MNAYLTAEEVADRYRTSVKAIHDKTRRDGIPFIKRPGIRRILFPIADLELWDEGAGLEVLSLPDGGKRVKPNQQNGGG